MPSLFQFLLSLSLATFVAAGNLQFNKPDPRKMLDVTEPITVEWRIDADGPEARYDHIDVWFRLVTDSGSFSYLVGGNLSVNVGISVYAWDPSQLAKHLLDTDLVFPKQPESVFELQLHGGSSDADMGHRSKKFAIEGYGPQLSLGDMVRPTWGLSVLLAAAVLLLVGC